ncbi:hypothetical protein G6F36_011751 [Rhizopus arrhizus]|nr:hypothetical protein G6F36_011751 [Rhizopus arrhizus]
MEVDEEAYPLDDVTNYDLHMDLKPPEKEKRTPKITNKTTVSKDASQGHTRKIHRGDETKEMFFFYVYEKGLTAGKAASLMNILRKTGYNWLQKDQNKLVDRLEGKVDDDVDNLTEKRGRKPLLNANHKEYLEKSFGENPSVTIDQAMDSLTNQFEGLKVSKQTVRDFMVINWSKTDLDYQSNCVFIDEAAFHVNLKRTMGWSKKGERAIVETPTTRAQTTTILGAISPHGIINVKGFYIVMDNVPIHKNTDIERYIINRGYGCVYLPPYSPELNPIEQFWSVVKKYLMRAMMFF